MENKELIEKALNFIRQNFVSSEITLSQVAYNAGFSIDYFNKIFVANTGFTVMAYVNYLRLKKASVLLSKTDKSIIDIALDVGYDSHEGFSRAFKREYGQTPMEFRNRKELLCWADTVDNSVINRFFLENPQFRKVDTEMVIDFLLENDAKRYGYLCTTIKYMGMQIASVSDDLSDGFVCVGDNRNGDYYLELVNDDFNVLCKWLERLNNVSAFYHINDLVSVLNHITDKGFNMNIKETPQSIYMGGKFNVDLTENIFIRKLTYADKSHILSWANGKRNGYIDHLLSEKDYEDESVLDFGVFSEDEMIAVVNCGIDSVHGYALNNCCNIIFKDNREQINLYMPIFKFVTNYIIELGAIPFDDIQNGEYAKTHGDFTSEELGFEIVNRRYDIIK